MIVPIRDDTTHWGPILAEACNRWNAVLALRGISLVMGGAGPGIDVYETSVPHGIAEGDGDGRLAEGQWAALDGVLWSSGTVTCFYDPTTSSHPDWIDVCVAGHELGHAMMLDHAPQHSDSIMTPMVENEYPTLEDAMWVFKGYIPTPPPPPPPKKDKMTGKAGMKKRKKKRKGKG